MDTETPAYRYIDYKVKPSFSVSHISAQKCDFLLLLITSERKLPKHWRERLILWIDVLGSLISLLYVFNIQFKSSVWEVHFYISRHYFQCRYKRDFSYDDKQNFDEMFNCYIYFLEQRKIALLVIFLLPSHVVS